MWIGHRGDCTVQHREAGKLGRHHHRAFDVKVRVNKSGKNKTAGLCDRSDGPDFSAVDGNLGRHDPPNMQVNQIGGDGRRHFASLSGRWATLQREFRLSDAGARSNEPEFKSENRRVIPSFDRRNELPRGTELPVDVEANVFPAYVNEPILWDSCLQIQSSFHNIIPANRAIAQYFYHEVRRPGNLHDQTFFGSDILESPALDRVPIGKCRIGFTGQLDLWMNQ